MKKPMITAGIFLTLFAFLSAGCRSVKLKVQYDDVRTGMFENNRTNLIDKFFSIKRNLTTTEDLERLGFKLKAKNLRVVVGINAFREVFGQDVFRDSDINELTKSFQELNLYTLYEIPYKSITNVSDRIYWSKKVTIEKGYDDMYSIVTRSNLVIYAAPRQVYKDTKRIDKAFARGLIEIIGELSGSLGAAGTASKFQ